MNRIFEFLRRRTNAIFTMASPTPTLAIAAGNTITTWRWQEAVDFTSNLCPLGDLPIADFTWNHNGQGKQLTRSLPDR